MLKIKCSNCGALKEADNKRWTKNLEKFGDVKTLVENYLCRVCRRETTNEYYQGTSGKSNLVYQEYLKALKEVEVAA